MDSDAFMLELFADLDGAVFDDLPSSPVQSRSSLLSRSNRPQPRPTPKPLLPLHASSHSTNATASTSTSTLGRPSIPAPFWDSSQMRAGPPPGRITHGGAGEKRSRPASPTKPGRAGMKYLQVEIEEQENVFCGEGFRDKGKGKEVIVKKVKIEEVVKVEVMEGIDFDTVLDGMDWDDMDMLSQNTTPAIPHSKRYIRCKVESIEDTISVKTRRAEKILIVKVKGAAGTSTVLLCDDWVETTVEVGDTINLIGPFDPTISPSLVVDRNNALLILHPDILVSSTKVADSSHCARKALLQELIRTTGGGSKALVYGNMLHELMQSCMVEHRWEETWRHDKIDEILRREVQTLWSIDLTVDKAREDMREKSREFEAFKDKFVGQVPRADGFLTDPRVSDDDRALLAVTDTLEIEEDIWSPKYGLKGKPDVSIAGRIREDGLDGEIGTLPFEIKTGKSYAGMEHRAQTMLYTLLMSDRYDETIESGLLYYSQSNQLIRVKPARNDIRGLLIARNEFATFLHRRMNLSRTSDPYLTQEATLTSSFGAPASQAHLIDDEGTALLPPPIDDERSCKWCYAADACMLFRKAVEGENEISFDEGDPLQVAFEAKTGHLTDAHSTFFKSWEKLISLEEQELVRFKKEIWTMDAQERMDVGRALAKMSIDETFVPPPNKAGSKIHRYTYRLHLAEPLATQATRSQRSAKSLLSGNLVKNDPVVVSLEHPSVLSISRGFVLEVTPHTIVLGLDHSLIDTPQAMRAKPQLLPSELEFRIDKDELSAGLGRIRDNLIQIFVAGGDEKRRRLVVDLEEPEFETVHSNELLVSPSLNEDQVRAVRKALSAKDYALILGMPGTGKTTTIAEVIKALAAAGKSVLLTSYTHSAVDNILLKLMDSGISILRLGNRDKIMPVLHQFTLDPECKAETLTALDHQLMTPQIVATTCLGINDPIFTRRRFDVCIVDEASQVTLPTCLGPLRFADSFILVGDHNQLPPLVRNLDARKGGYDTSLFKRLTEAHPSAVVYLTHQYRMNEDIMLLSNKLIYSDQLKVGSEEVARQRLELPHPEGLDDIHDHNSHAGIDCWIRDLLDADRKVVFVDTDRLPARELKRGSLIENEVEGSLIFQIAHALVKCGIKQDDIGVIALYRQQIKLISRLLHPYPDIEVLTADKSQGRDKDCILMSLTRSNAAGQVGDLLKDWRRINVCLTRAKSKLIVFGSRSTLSHDPLLQEFFDVVASRGWIYQLAPLAHEEHEGPSTPTKGERDTKSARERRGAGARALEGALARDVVNSM